MPHKWKIYHIDNCRHVIPKAKQKLVAIVGMDMSAFFGFFISSEMSEWVKNNPQARAYQVEILSSEHKILHDSFVNCLQLYQFSEDELVNLRCTLSSNAISAIKKVVLNSKTLNAREKRLILD